MSLPVLGVVFVVIALVLFFVLRKGSTPAKRPAPAQPSKESRTTEFHAVSLRFASSACSAAKSLEGERFLSSAAPRIPLPDCDVLKCKCRFMHHKDRREGDDRRNPYVGAFTGQTGRFSHEKRLRSERRKDHDPD